VASAGVQFRAVGASLDTLAQRCKELPRGSVQAFAYANSGVLQIAGKIVADKYIVSGTHAEPSPKSGRLIYTAPPGATHGPFSTTKLSKYGERFGRDAKGRWGPLKPEDVAQVIHKEHKIFVKGKFVSRSTAMDQFAEDLAKSSPAESVSRRIAGGYNPWDHTSTLVAEVDANGRGIIALSGGYRAAEAGSRGRSNGIKGWWRGLRTASTRWGTLIKKRYPELLALGAR
jgi:hypothetical protein